MQFILSPAKTIDLNATCPDGMESLPDFSNQAIFLMSKLKNIDQSRLKKLMKLSEKLSKTVWDWHQNWECSEAVDKALRAGARPCAFAMQGEAFKFLGLPTLKNSDIEFAQSHLLIISGLYGLLRP